MILDRFAARQALKAVGLVLMSLGLLPIRIEPGHAQGAPSNLRPAPEPQGRSHIDGESAHAYHRAAPRSAERRTIVLTVLDDETSRPVTDSEVRINALLDFRTHAFRTGPRGRLLVEYPSLHGEPRLSIAVQKDGYVPLGRGWGFEGSPGPPEAWTFRLRRGTTMGGIVDAGAERPVEGATVLMTVTSYGPGARPANSTGSEYYHEIPSRTGPDGRWRTDSVPPGADDVKLRLIHPDFVSDAAPTLGWPARSPRLAALREQSDRQALLRGLALEGRVIDEQERPIAGARIDDSTRALGSSQFAWCHPADAEGRFHFHLPRGKSFLLTAAAEGYARGSQAVSPDPDQPAITFQLVRGKRLRGRVVDPSGHPIEAAQVFAVMESPIKPLSFQAWTDEHGRFEWGDAPAEAVEFRIAAEGYIEDKVHQLTAGDAVAEVTLRPAVDVRIAAIDAQTREAIPRFPTQIGTHDTGTNGFRWGPRMGRSAPRRFEILLAAENGPYQFEISAEGYLPARILVPRERVVLRRAIPLEKAAR
jgi:Carboxypeptidase regulatory-like domain